jgi:hypothetical protein
MAAELYDLTYVAKRIGIAGEVGIAARNRTSARRFDVSVGSPSRPCV